MALYRYEPARLVSQLQDEVNRVFTALSSAEETSGATSTWTPLVDITEYPDHFELAVDLPGVDPEKVEITLEEGVLTLSGERETHVQRAAAPESVETRTRVERGHGRFHRRFVLPDMVDSERVQASGRNGVLEIRIPKQPKALPRRIKIAS
jgi:HSP20 family protein